ncbi:MAG: GNAT family N-acetyltransferase [Ignavibacteriae bacterium]|nr:GNAT family N-acetyltransferase [Ignavibacteriota bacterium]
MKELVTYRIAVEKDVNDLVDLINSQYNRKYIPEYFNWQYFYSVYPSALMCAFNEDEKLIGMFGVQKKELSNGAVALQAIDLLLKQEYRGKGIFKILGEKAFNFFERVDLYCVLPNFNGKNSIEKSFGWQTIAKINEFVLTVSPDTKANNIEFNEKIILSKNFVSFNNNCDIRNWRYIKHPIYKYKIFENGNDIIVTKLFIYPVSNQKYGDIVEYHYSTENFNSLFKEAIMYFYEMEVEIIGTWALSHTSLYPVLKKIGFYEIEKQRYFCIKINNHKYDFLNDIKNWNLNQSDAEIY